MALQVPVGGAVVCAPSAYARTVDAVSNLYPGRASLTPILDVFITFLQMVRSLSLGALFASRRLVCCIGRRVC